MASIYVHYAFIFITFGSVAAGFALLAIWVGLALWPAWYWRAAAMFAALVALLPVEAYEPAALFLLVMPATALGSFALARRWRAHANDIDETCAAAWTFSLRDLLLLVLFAGIASAMIALLWRKDVYAQWPALLAQAGGFAAVAVALAAIHAKPSRWARWPILALCLAGLYAAHRYLDDVWGIGEYFVREEWPPKSPTLASIATLPYAVLISVGLIASSLFVATDRFTHNSAMWRGMRLATRIAVVSVSVVAMSFASWIYSQMLFPAPIPRSSHAPDSSLPRLLALIEEAQALNPAETAFVEVPDADPRQVNALRRIYFEIRAALDKDPAFQINFARDTKAHRYQAPLFDERIECYQAIRGLARSWLVEADWAAKAGRLEEAVTYAVSTVQLGHMIGRGGDATDTAVGAAVERIGLRDLHRRRADLPTDSVREILLHLERIDSSREDSQQALARDRVIVDRTYTCRHRLDFAIGRLQGNRI